MSNVDLTVYIVYAREQTNGREPIVAVVASENAIKPIIEYCSRIAPSIEVRWESQKVINGSAKTHSVYLAVQNDLDDPVVAAVHANKEEAYDYVIGEISRGLTNRFILNVEIGWDPKGSLIDTVAP